MSIYTITLKRELLSSSEGEGGPEEGEDCGQANWFERDLRFGQYDSDAAQAASASSSSKEQQNCKRIE